MDIDTSHLKDVLAERVDSSTCSLSVLPLSLNTFRSWLGQAKPGERLEYHHGFLTVDRSSASRLTDHERRGLAKLADAALKAAEADQVHLVQRRNGPADFSYLAIKAGPDAQSTVTALPVVTASLTPAPDSCPGSSG